MIRLLLTLALALAMAGGARAQTEPAVVFNAAAPPDAVAAPAGSMAIFTAIFQAVDTPIQGAAAGIVNAAAATTRTWVVAGLSVWLALWCVGEMFAPGSMTGGVFSGLFRELLHGAIAMAVIQIYAEVVMPMVLTTIPGELTALFTFGNTPRADAGVAANYDAVWNAVRELYIVVADRIPDSWAPKIVIMSAMLGILKLIGFVFIMAAFWFFLGAHVIEIILSIIGVVFVGMAAFPTLRKYAWGWLSSLLATMATIALLSLILGLMLSLITSEGRTLSALPGNTAMEDQFDGFAGVIGCLFLLACTVGVMPFVGLAIFGGVHNATNIMGAAVKSAGSGVMAGGRKIAGALG